jgi:CheY-like chemotaxis protein
MEAIGYGVELARNGAQALRRFEPRRPDLVILDLMIPRFTGFEVLWRLRGPEAEGRTVPLLILGARTSREDIVKGFNLGGSDYVTKPFMIGELRACPLVARACRSHILSTSAGRDSTWKPLRSRESQLSLRPANSCRAAGGGEGRPPPGVRGAGPPMRRHGAAPGSPASRRPMARASRQSPSSATRPSAGHRGLQLALLHMGWAYRRPGVANRLLAKARTDATLRGATRAYLSVPPAPDLLALEPEDVRLVLDL